MALYKLYYLLTYLHWLFKLHRNTSVSIFDLFVCCSVCVPYYMSVSAVCLLQTWNQHFFVLTTTHLYYTEEQQQDATDADDAAADDDVVSCYLPA